MMFCLGVCTTSCVADSVNQDSDLLPISKLRSHLPIQGTFPVSVYCQISHG